GALGRRGLWRDIAKIEEDLEGIGIDFTSYEKGGKGCGQREMGEQRMAMGVGLRDRWRWMLQENGDFTVKELTRLVEEKVLQVENGNQETLWNNWLPKKVNIFSFCVAC
ncbi:hypothetical protein Tco_1553323, partial [Tanacetum coccineum]